MQLLRPNVFQSLFFQQKLNFDSTLVILCLFVSIVGLVGFQVRKTRIYKRKSNNHIIDHIIINVLPASLHHLGLFHRKKNKKEYEKIEHEKDRYEKELEYLKKIV